MTKKTDPTTIFEKDKDMEIDRKHKNVMAHTFYKEDGVRIGCPSNVDLLLHCHCSPEPHPRLDTPAVYDGINILLRLGAIKLRKKNVWHTTPLGAAWVASICNTALPKEETAFLDENGKVINNV